MAYDSCIITFPQLAGVVLTEAQITQLEIGPDTNLDPEQRESVEEAKQRSVKQDALKRLNEIQPLNEVEMILSETQVFYCFVML